MSDRAYSARDSAAPREAKPAGATGSDWLFRYSVLKWMFQPTLRRQLPVAYRAFGAYCRLYLRITRAPHVRGARLLFRAAARLSGLTSSADYLRIQLPDYEVYLDRTDPRLLQVVNELTNEQADTRVLSALLSEGDTFIDVGANHGSFSIVAAGLVGAKGCIVSVEPQPRLAKAIEKSLEANAACRFQVLQMALGDRNGQIDLLIPRDSSGAAGIYPNHSGSGRHRKVKVPLGRFDEVVDWQGLPGSILVKLDVEGSEPAFLAGAKEMFAERKPTLIIEIHPGTLKASGHTGEDLKALLADLGYERYAELRRLEETAPLERLDTFTHRNVVVSMTP